MSFEQFNRIEKWFYSFIQKYYNDFPEQYEPFNIKEQHTKRVQKAMAGLADCLKLDDEKKQLADLIALLHDVARFEQFARYKTFADARSVNHGTLGVEILEKTGILNDLDNLEKQIILSCVGHHNALNLPEDLSEEEMLFLQLIRDADKLDVLRLAANYYHLPPKKRQESISLELGDDSVISEAVFNDFMDNRLVIKEHLKSLQDFKVLQLSWLYDINFIWTFRQIHNEKLLEKIWITLPDLPEKAIIQVKIRELMAEKQTELK